MPYKDLHEEPFDETTIAKLEIFEDYAQAWLPTFIEQGPLTLCIFDFFAGTGYDVAGVAGSPIRILQKIKEQIGRIFQKGIKIQLYFNEFQPKKREQWKYEKLRAACDEFLEANKDVKRAIGAINFYNEDFETLFSKLLPDIRKYPSLVYLDQNGMKYLSDKYFLELEKTTQTDFLYFVSASYFWRFGDSKEFKEHVNIDVEATKKGGYKLVHQNLVAQLRKKLPADTKVKLYPFSLKKGANIHGIIFGASHIRAVDKFLSIAWKRNGTNGQANFDMDEDSKKVQFNLFEEKPLTKREAFEKEFREKVLAGEIKNNFEALQFAFDRGHLGGHAADCLREMKKSGEIEYEGGYPLVTYENVYKNKKQIIYKLKGR